MRVGMLYDGDYPWDIRAWKTLASFVEHGHEVHLVCRNLARRPAEETADGVQIHRLRPRQSSRLNTWTTFPLWMNPVWLSRLAEVSRRHHLEALIVRDLPLTLTAVCIGRRHRIPVVMDMAENYPAFLRDIWQYERFRPQNVLVRNPALATLVERAAVRLVDLVAVVIEEARDRLIRAGVPADKIVVVRNTPRIDLTQYPAAWGPPTRDPDCLSLAFVGGLEPMRGLEAVLDMLPAALAQVPELRLTIVGEGRWRADLERRARELRVDGRVVFRGRQEYQRALFEVERADIGLIPHRITAHTSSTIPNKLFEYMLLGKPVLATDMPPVRRIIQEVDCGLVYQTPEAGVASIARLRDPAERRRLGDNGRRAVIERYRWDRDADDLLGAMERLVGPASRGVRSSS